LPAVLVLAFVFTGAAAGRAVTPVPVAVTELTLTMSDGVPIAATLFEPTTGTPPYPAVLMLHGLGGKRQDLTALSQALSARGYAVLTADFRGHGQSGGLVSIDGPREIQDVREEVAWLKARADVNGKVGAWGISLGGGAILRALVEGVPFNAVETVETWTDLYGALAPQNLAKSGAVSQFLNSVPEDRQAPELKAIRDDAIRSQHLATTRQFCVQRSSRQFLSRVKTPVFMLQGRRDFAFDIAQAKAAMRLLRGPKRLYIGDFGHAPSTFPGPDIAHVEDEMGRWFDTYLRSMTNRPSGEFELAPEAASGSTFSSSRLPAVRSSTFRLSGRDTIGAEGKVVRDTGPTARRLEMLGSATVRVDARLTGGWERLVAVLTAKPAHGSEIVVSEGGINTRGLAGRRRLAIHLIDDATKIPRRSRLTLTLAASSTAQDPANLLYLDLPMPAGAKLTVGRTTLSLPLLRKPISR
jgi:ABC-2 type transport system ATP-binding protein